ncbi:hypothetical protein SK128_001777 [Halocaridina rubra]|uniref:Lipocalin/cytosolic fatty-acid binding domain-containing protein n=1 Tax=Halocaridina rubra TaxID=373956 RepID=A0AAN8XB59_HALRR
MVSIKIYLVSLVLGVMTYADPGCVEVSPASNYVNALYVGRWYEIGRIQTPGGASYQENCWCDTTDFTTEFLTVGDGEVTYSCRQDGPDGALQSATADLLYEGEPGHFKQQFRFPFAPKLDYSIIFIDEDTAMEYDCHTDLQGDTDYCVHFMSRFPSIEENKLLELIEYAEGLGLNNQNVNYTATEHVGCW